MGRIPRRRLRKQRNNNVPSINLSKHDFRKPYMLRYAVNIIDHISLHDEKHFQFCLDVIGSENCIPLLNTIYDIDESTDIDSLDNNYKRIRSYNRFSSMASEIYEDYSDKKLSFSEHEILNHLKSYLHKNQSIIAKKDPELEYCLKELKNTFNLNSDDIDVLTFVFMAYETNYSALNNICNDVTYRDFIRLVSLATGISLKHVSKTLSLQGMLYSSGIIENIDHDSGTLIDLDDNICEFLSGISDTGIVEKFIRPDRGNTLKPGSFDIPAERTALMTSLVSSGRPCNILIYGIAGTGKTEYARSLIKSTGRSCYFLQYGEEQNSRRRSGSMLDDDTRFMALRVALNTVEKNGGVLIVDEADYIINTMPVWFGSSSNLEKGRLNNFLETSQATIIWISNEVRRMEASTLRRFSFSLYFDELTGEQRLNIWKNRLKGHSLKKHLPLKLIKALSEEYQVDAGAITSALNTLDIMLKNNSITQDEIEPTLRTVLSRHESLLTGNHKEKRKKNENESMSGNYDLSVLNIDAEIDSIVSGVNATSQNIKKNKNKHGMNLLFWGLPGTGKTEFARYLSRKTGMKLLLKRYSDLESMWVGVTEQNIARAFKEAEDKKAILFIDEADSFFTSRENAYRSWEVSRTNEFLTQMESHKTILICCTNLLPTMDRAAMRRFHWKAEFKPLLPQSKLKLYKKFFNQKDVRLTAPQAEKIKALKDLTPGDLYAFHQRMVFMKDSTHKSIINELEKEIKYKNTDKIMGFLT